MPRSTTYGVNAGIGKPGQTVFIDNVKTEGGSFVLRVYNGSNYKDYTIKINRPTKKTGVEQG